MLFVVRPNMCATFQVLICIDNLPCHTITVCVYVSCGNEIVKRALVVLKPLSLYQFVRF